MVCEGACQVAEDERPGEPEWTVSITCEIVSDQAPDTYQAVHMHRFWSFVVFFFFLKAIYIQTRNLKKKKTIDNAKEKYKRPITPSIEITTFNISFGLS